MAHGVNNVLSDGNSGVKINNNNQVKKQVGVMGSRRIFSAIFKLKVLDSYRNDIDCRGNQRATARKYGIHRRQIQKWLQCEDNLRNCAENTNNNGPQILDKNIKIDSSKIKKSTVQHQQQQVQQAPALNLSLARLHGDELTSRQGSPLSHLTLHQQQRFNSHSPTLSSSSSTTTTNSIPVRGQLITYSDYPIVQQQQQQAAAFSSVPHHQDNNGMNNYSHDRTVSPNERKYYYPSPPYDQTTVVYCPQTDSSTIYNQQATCSYQAKSGHGYNGIIVERDHHGIVGNTGVNQSSSHVQLPLSSNSHNRRDIDSPGNDLFMPATTTAAAIKTECASPDSPASSLSPSSYTSTILRSSIGTTTITTTPQATTITINPNENNTYTQVQNSINQQKIPVQQSSINSVHFDTPRQSPEIQTRIAHDSVEKNNTHDVLYAKQENEDKIIFKNELPRILKLKEETTDEHYDIYHNNNNGEKGSMDYRISSGPLSQSTIDGQSRGTLSPGRDVNYLNSNSPRGTASISSRSTISSCCSDSEIDPLDYSSNNNQIIANNMPRRRSFPLTFKIDVLNAFYKDCNIAGNQRATARKFGINRRQVQKWLGQETELRGEISLRGGDLRQRLSALQEVPVDLRTPGGNSDIELIDQSSLSPQSYCCDSSSSQRSGYYPSSIITEPDVPQRNCTLSCCSDNLTTTSSVSSSYPESRRDFYHESQGSYCCYSPKEQENIVPDINDGIILSPASKRSACTLSCCSDNVQDAKRQRCVEDLSEKEDQEMPLCLVKPKDTYSDSLVIIDEVVSTTVPTTVPLFPTTKKDAILFKPYLDNPISKPGDNHHQRDFRNNNQSVIVDNNNSNNNNCRSICNDERSHVYSVDVGYRVPVSWGTTHLGYSTQIPDGIRSAFARYPVTPQYS